MNVLGLLVDTSGASQPAFNTYPCCAAQPVGGDVVHCVELEVVSFNFGMPQSMLESDKRWNQKHVTTFREVLMMLGHASDNDFVLGCEVGEVRKGFRAANMDFDGIVQQALPGAECSSSGAYLHVWNVRQQAAVVVASGTWTATTARSTDLHWQAYDLTYRDASQLADRDATQLAAQKVGLVVGNMHIPVGGYKPPSMTTRRRTVDQALRYLADLEVDAWRGRQKFQVTRVLVGNCSLSKEDAQAAAQMAPAPRLTALQRDLQRTRWQVCDAPYLRQSLESARLPCGWQRHSLFSGCSKVHVRTYCLWCMCVRVPCGACVFVGTCVCMYVLCMCLCMHVPDHWTIT